MESANWVLPAWPDVPSDRECDAHAAILAAAAAAEDEAECLRLVRRADALLEDDEALDHTSHL